MSQTHPRVAKAIPAHRRHRGVPRRGFSFTEVLFAVMILGVGFIMIAAIFPVSLTQTKATGEETAAASLVRSAVNYVERFASDTTMEATDNVVVMADYDPSAPANGSLWEALQQNAIPPSDTRYAWLPLYLRAGTATPPVPGPTWSSYAQIILIPMSSRNQSTFTLPPEIVHDTTAVPANRGRATISATINDSGNNADPDTIVFATAPAPAAAVPGAYVIVSDARQGPGMAHYFNGRIYRLGMQTGNPLIWELAPGNDFTPEMVDADLNPVTPNTNVTRLVNALVFVVGRGIATSGTGEDVAVYTTFVKAK